MQRLAVDRDVTVRSLTVSPGRPISRFTNVPPMPHASFGDWNTTICPRFGIAEAIRDAVCDHAVVEAALAPCARLRAVERRLHRRRRDAIRLRDLGLEHEHEDHRHADRHDPVEQLLQARHLGMVVAMPRGSSAGRAARGGDDALDRLLAAVPGSSRVPGLEALPGRRRLAARARAARRRPRSRGRASIVRRRPAMRRIASFAIRSASAGCDAARRVAVVHDDVRDVACVADLGEQRDVALARAVDRRRSPPGRRRSRAPRRRTGTRASPCVLRRAGRARERKISARSASNSASTRNACFCVSASGCRSVVPVRSS